MPIIIGGGGTGTGSAGSLLFGTGTGGGFSFECPDFTGTGTGSGTGFPSLLAGHLIDFIDGEPVYYVHCDECLLFETEGRQGRLIDFAGSDRLPVYSGWPKCCEYPFTDPFGTGTADFTVPVFEEETCFGAPISEILKVRVTSTYDCPNFQCFDVWPPIFREATLRYDGSAWVGCIGALCLRITCAGVGALTTELSGCRTLAAQETVVVCAYPLHYQVHGIQASWECCGCDQLVGAPGTGNIPSSRIDLDIYGYCDRGHAAKLVDLIPDRVGTGRFIEVYSTFECCQPPKCQPPSCCDDNAVCAMIAHFIGDGTCGCFDGASIILYPTGGSWRNNLVDCDGHEAGVALFCLCPGKRMTQFAITLSCAPNCATQAYVPPETFDCSDHEFDIEFDVPLICTDACDPPHRPCCCGEGSSGGAVGSHNYTVRITRYIP